MNMLINIFIIASRAYSQQYYGGKNTCENNRMRYAQKVRLSLALLMGVDSMDRRGIVVEPRLLNLPIHKQ